MNKTSLLTLLLMAGAALPASAVEDAYSLNLSRGKFPADVAVANLNGVAPEMSAYARGWTEEGWIVNRLDDHGYVALSPTYAPGASCENSLSLPALQVEDGMQLSWQAKSVYRHFSESYRVVATPTDGSDTVELAAVEAEASAWTDRTADLSPLAGKEVTVSFICTSADGYMFALDKVRIGAPLTEEPDDPTVVEPVEGFPRKLLVDHGTGMWCTNCPSVEAELDRMMNLYGDRLIMLNTHVNDVLGNDPYWKELDWYAVPYMMLNRIQASAGDSSKKFNDYIDQPTDFTISVEGSAAEGETSLSLTADVMVAKEVDNSAGRYRVGFVLTADYHDPKNPSFVQQNGSSTQPSAGAFYYLPKLIAPPLMFYDDVTLTSATAFSGVEDSLPASLEPGKTYTVEYDMTLPELQIAPEEVRVVGFVLDTVTGEALNADARLAGEKKPDTGVDNPEVTASTAISIDPEGIRLIMPDGVPYQAAIYTVDGRRIETTSGAGSSIWRPRHADGLCIIVLTTPDATRTLKTLL